MLNGINVRSITPSSPTTQIYHLSPSGLTFMFEECRRCFYLERKLGIRRPRSPFPKIFGAIDQAMKDRLTGRSLLLAGQPNAVVGRPQLRVESEPISVAGSSSQVVLWGWIDSVLEFSDGGFGILDCKTSTTKDEHIPLYGRQLHAYAYCLERPAPKKPSLRPIKWLGLLVFEPNDFATLSDDRWDASLSGTLSSIQIPRDDQAFLDLISDVVQLLDRPEPPLAAPTCQYCRYRQAAA